MISNVNAINSKVNHSVKFRYTRKQRMPTKYPMIFFVQLCTCIHANVSNVLFIILLCAYLPVDTCE